MNSQTPFPLPKSIIHFAEKLNVVQLDGIAFVAVQREIVYLDVQ